MRFSSVRPPLLLLLFAVATATGAQRPGGAPRALTAADYARAEKFQGAAVTSLVFSAGVRPTWLADGRFWYRNAIPGGHELIIVDPSKKTRARAFDHAKVAATLSTAAGGSWAELTLPLTTLELTPDGKSITVTVGTRRFTCDVQGPRCTAAPLPSSPPGGGPLTMSPDGKSGAFIRTWNLWVRDIASGRETQLTTDGVKDYSYALDNAGWTKSDRAVVVWSPDSKKLATFQQDERNVGDMYVVRTRAGHPELEAWKYPLPGDSVIQVIHRVIIDLASGTPRMVRLQIPPDAHRSTLCDHIVCGGTWADVQWSPDGAQLAFVSTSRDHKVEKLRIADAATGAVREVFEEKVATQFESGQGRVNWRALFGSNEFIWFSERSDMGRLYLHDLATGRLKNEITGGEGRVQQILRADEETRTIFFLGLGKEKGRDPYFRHLYKVGFDGKNMTLLTPEDGDHDFSVAPDWTYFTDSYSKPDVPPTAVVRDTDGQLVMPLEKADISRLLATGWKPPIPVTMKGRDGRTDIYGLLYAPTRLDSSRKYPVIDAIYPGPQSGSVGSRSWTASSGDAQAMAELGFVVVRIDGMGTPNRSKSFHDAWYGNMGDNTLPDQVTGIKQLAARYRWIDVDRVGITGGSGGGFASVDAMFRYPDFFKVAVSSSGNHDNRVYEDDWGERYQGLLVRNPDGTTNYDNQANQLVARNLKGKLLITHGGMDNNVPPYNTLLVVDALINANKDFDLLIFPNQRHGYGDQSTYMTRRKWDYFVKWLMGADPPREYEMKR
jgi:dipeptidyl aminopeptidase/acylaminoacyl peptidase